MIRASLGLGASSGMIQAWPTRTAEGIRPSLHRTWMRRGEIPHRSAVCKTDNSTVLFSWIVNLLNLFYYKRESEQNQYNLISFYQNQSHKNPQAGHLGPKRCFCLLVGWRPQAPFNRRIDPAAVRFCKTLWPLTDDFMGEAPFLIPFIQRKHRIKIGPWHLELVHLAAPFIINSIELL